MINKPYVVYMGGHRFSSQLLLCGGTATIYQPGLINQWLSTDIDTFPLEAVHETGCSGRPGCRRCHVVMIRLFLIEVQAPSIHTRFNHHSHQTYVGKAELIYVDIGQTLGK